MCPARVPGRRVILSEAKDLIAPSRINPCTSTFVTLIWRQSTLGPAVYLIFSSKEEVLRSLVTQIFNELLREVRVGLSKHDRVADKLTFALHN